MTSFRIQELKRIGFEWRICLPVWEECLSELAEYHKIHGHCNVPGKYSENSKLANWVATQRKTYRFVEEGKRTPIMTSRIQKLESLGFEWRASDTTREDRLRELADYYKTHGHCNVPTNYSENFKLANWVATQRKDYKAHQEGKKSPMTILRIQEFESLGFEWEHRGAAWDDRFRELAEHRKIHGHCNVPRNSKLSKWVQRQRHNYKVQHEGKKSLISSLQIQELESLGFEWYHRGAAWEARFKELAEHRKISGHCNVPRNCSKNIKLGKWSATQRSDYVWVAEGKSTPMTTARIQKMESLGFEWRVTTWEDRLSELADYHKIYGHCNVTKSYSGKSKLGSWVAE